jgi:anti-sigma-K factor RskA
MPANPPEHAPDPDEAVPVFGSWRRIHAAVALCALLVMALLLLFSRWPY